MAGSFLGRWFARPPARSEELDPALRELDQHIAARPAFREPLDGFLALVSRQSRLRSSSRSASRTALRSSVKRPRISTALEVMVSMTLRIFSL